MYVCVYTYIYIYRHTCNNDQSCGPPLRERTIDTWHHGCFYFSRVMKWHSEFPFATRYGFVRNSCFAPWQQNSTTIVPFSVSALAVVTNKVEYPSNHRNIHQYVTIVGGYRHIDHIHMSQYIQNIHQYVTKVVGHRHIDHIPCCPPAFLASPPLA